MGANKVWGVEKNQKICKWVGKGGDTFIWHPTVHTCGDVQKVAVIESELSFSNSRKTNNC